MGQLKQNEFFKLFVIASLSIISLNCNTQTSTSYIELVEPTIDIEAASIWRTINDYTFLEKQGYNINLPKNSLIDSLIVKSENATFGNDDFSAIYTLLETEVFSNRNYKQALQKVENNMDQINALIKVIDLEKGQWDWDFKMFKKYKVVLTLYGTGGSYDPDEGIITLLTNNEGEFMNYKEPINTIIHEITHMGMEYSIVQKYRLSHGLKERIVDTFVSLMFQEKLPEYRIQTMGNPEIDNYLKKKEDIDNLNAIISKFVD